MLKKSFFILCFFLCLFALGSLLYAQEAVQEAAKNVNETSIFSRFVSFLGIFGLIFIAYLLSVKRDAINWKMVMWGVCLQLLLGCIILNEEISGFFYTSVDKSVEKLLEFSKEGTAFVLQGTRFHEVNMVGFGSEGLTKTPEIYPPLARPKPFSFIPYSSPVLHNFMFWILPTIIFFSSLMAILYHLGIMQFLVNIVAKIMQSTMGTSGSETLSAAANIFVGQTEAPLVVKPFIEKMTNSELHAIMVGGFATVAGGVMAVYVLILGGNAAIPNIAGHLVMASIMSAPAALAISKVMYPETEESATAGAIKMEIKKIDANIIEAAARGASEGLYLMLNVAAMLLAFVAIVFMLNFFLSFIPLPLSWTPDQSGVLSIQIILAWVFAPIAVMMGVPPSESMTVGMLLGEKLVLTEIIAYIHLADIMRENPNALSQRSIIICSYALCGFANFASIGIQIGGIGGIAPSRRSDLAKLGMRAMIGGAIAACMTGTVAGIFLS